MLGGGGGRGSGAPRRVPTLSLGTQARGGGVRSTRAPLKPPADLRGFWGDIRYKILMCALDKLPKFHKYKIDSCKAIILLLSKVLIL